MRTVHPWIKTWGFCGLLVLLMSAALDRHWRSRGHQPSVTDDESLWAAQRERAARHGDRSVVLLGASRMQLGFSMPVFHRRFPELEAIQLAVLGGGAGLAPLVDLCHDERFNGLAVCSLTEPWLDDQPLRSQKRYVDFYRREWRLERRVRRHLQTWIQERTTLTLPRTGLSQHFHHALTSPERLRPHHVLMTGDRGSTADFTGIDPPAAVSYRLPPPPERWPDQAGPIAAAVARLQARGGQVIFVRLPEAEEHWRRLETTYPRARYWDRLEGLLGAPTLHFLDLTGGSFFELPDGCHLDRRDAPRFTQLLLDDLAARGLLPGLPDRPGKTGPAAPARGMAASIPESG